MAELGSNQTDLTKLLESLSVNEEGSAAEEALSNILGVNVPLDAGVETAARFFAGKLGLKTENSLVQTATFVLTACRNRWGPSQAGSDGLPVGTIGETS